MHAHCRHGASCKAAGWLSYGEAYIALCDRRRSIVRVYVSQVEALRRLRHGGSQFVRVEHVHVNEGGQAVIGNVRSSARSS
jgi:hypothetical protein